MKLEEKEKLVEKVGKQKTVESDGEMISRKTRIKEKEGRKEDDGTGEGAEDKARRSSRKERRVKEEEDDGLEIKETEERTVKEDLREEVDGVAALLDALLPVLHEVAQGEQGVVAHRDHVFRRPGVHGHQHDASVELILVDLLSSEKKNRRHQIKTEVKEEPEDGERRRHSPRRPCSPPIWQSSWSSWWNDGAARTDEIGRSTAQRISLTFLCRKA